MDKALYLARLTTVSTEQSEVNKLTPTVSTEQLGIIVDGLLEDYATILHPKYKKWYCKSAYKIGPNKFREIASKAMEGRNPSRLFSYLLKKELLANSEDESAY